jgi:hypothetical protein
MFTHYKAGCLICPALFFNFLRCWRHCSFDASLQQEDKKNKIPSDGWQKFTPLFSLG